MRIHAAIVCACVLAGSLTATAAEKGVTVSGVRHFSYPGFTRVVLEIEAAAPYVITKTGDGKTLSFSAYSGPLVVAPDRLPVIQDGVVKQLEARQDGERKVLAIVLAPSAGDFKDFVLRSPDRIVIDIQRGGAAPAAAAEGNAPVIMLDPGHGGSQNGIPSGRDMEKTATLEIAKTVRAILRKSPVKMNVLVTRESDLPLAPDERSAAANAAGATLFVSLHLGRDSVDRVFILDPDEGQAVTSGAGPSDFLGFDAVNEQQQTLWATQQAQHAPESGRLGRMIVRSLTGRDEAEPEQAPLALLRAVDAPATLVECGAGQDHARTAEKVARGIEQYVREKR
jgi:N-acetylmuramoyl-L-alanine amidase